MRKFFRHIKLIHPSIYLRQASWPISHRGTRQKTDRKEQWKKLTVQKVTVQLIAYYHYLLEKITLTLLLHNFAKHSVNGVRLSRPVKKYVLNKPVKFDLRFRMSSNQVCVTFRDKATADLRFAVATDSGVID